MANHLEETDIPIEYKGMKYNVSPSALRSNNLTVELPEVKVLGKRKNKGYKSAFDPNGAGEFAGTIMNSPLQLADYAFNRFIDASKGEHGKTDYKYTPVQTTMQRVGETLSPTRWIGTLKSGFKESPWSENNPGLTGNPYLDLVMDFGIGGLGIKSFKKFKGINSINKVEKTNSVNEVKRINNRQTTPISEDILNQALLDAENYKNSNEYRALVKSAIKESQELSFGKFSDKLFIDAGNPEHPSVTFQVRPKGDMAGYKRGTNVVSIDPAQVIGKYTKHVPYHEYLHWKSIGVPELNTPKYKAWAESFANNLPKETQDKLFAEFYDSPEYHYIAQLKKANKYLDYKINEALRPGASDYYKTKGELQANGLEAGRAVGIKPFTKYPGFDKASEPIMKAINYNPALLNIKLLNKTDYERFWNILTGQYIPAAVPLTIGGKYIYNNLNNNNK